MRLINALQMSPRASWAALAPILGADGVTLARRWRRLAEAGAVYTTAYPRPPGAPGTAHDGDPGAVAASGVVALLEMECAAGRTLEVAAHLAREPCAFTIDVTAGGRDIFVTAWAQSSQQLSDWALEAMQPLTGLIKVRTHPVSEVVSDAHKWHLRVLDKDQVAAVRALSVAPVSRRVPIHEDERVAILQALSADARVGAAEIAPRLGVTPRRARQLLATVLDERALTLRVDVARGLTKWPISAWYFLHVPATQVTSVAPRLARLEEVRTVMTAVGEYNVMVSVWLRTLQDVQRLEAILEERLPGVQIADRSVVLRAVKHAGHLLDADGFATGEVVPPRHGVIGSWPRRQR